MSVSRDRVLRSPPSSRAPAALITLAAVVLVSACGGGGASGGATASTDAPGPSAAAGATTTVAVSQWELAQTHLVPPEGRRWSLGAEPTVELHLTGGRDALVLVTLGNTEALQGLQIEGRVGTTALGAVALGDNASLPVTEASGARYSDAARPATVPTAWVRPGLELRVTASNAQPSSWQAVNVGADAAFAVRTLPLYLFGATESLVSLATASRPSATAMDELHAKWPFTQVAVDPLLSGRIDWPTVVVEPRNGNAAYVMTRAEDAKDGFDPISAAHSVTNAVRLANGEGGLAVQYYGAMVQANGDGSLASTGGGLGGGHVGAGDHKYAGIFYHEQGHAFGLPHAASGYLDGNFPTVGGSLAGSSWGFDAVRQWLQPTWVPSTASSFAQCAAQVYAGTPRQLDAQGRCIKQDPMQSGSGDQAGGDAYTILADYNAARLQQYMEGRTSVDANGVHSYTEGRIFRSTEFATGYKRWDGVDRRWVGFDPAASTLKGLYGVNDDFPWVRDTPVYTLVVSRSHAGTAGATEVSPLLIGPYTGNLLRTFDPTDAADRSHIVPNSGTYPWYCRGRGCDFTLRVTYVNGDVRHVVLRGGFRPWFGETAAPAAETLDPVNSASFKRWAVNVPAAGPIAQVELLDTPMVWNGMPVSPTVLASRAF